MKLEHPAGQRNYFSCYIQNKQFWLFPTTLCIYKLLLLLRFKERNLESLLSFFSNRKLVVASEYGHIRIINHVCIQSIINLKIKKKHFKNNEKFFEFLLNFQISFIIKRIWTIICLQWNNSKVQWKSFFQKPWTWSFITTFQKCEFNCYQFFVKLQNSGGANFYFKYHVLKETRWKLDPEKLSRK